jgi:chromosome segregation ATPase
MVELYVIPSLLLAGLVPFVATVLGRRLSGEESDKQITSIREEARALENKIIEVLAEENTWASKKQLSAVKNLCREFKQNLSSQRESRESLEQRLSASHADVLAREAAHQEVKTAKQDDEVALQAIVSNYNDISSESLSLEQRLAESLRTIDKMSAEVALSEDQRAILETLAGALTNASTQLRDVIVAHQGVYERLEALRAQYKDLEAEYIKLVELQLENP